MEIFLNFFSSPQTRRQVSAAAKSSVLTQGNKTNGFVGLPTRNREGVYVKDVAKDERNNGLRETSISPILDQSGIFITGGRKPPS